MEMQERIAMIRRRIKEIDAKLDGIRLKEMKESKHVMDTYLSSASMLTKSKMELHKELKRLGGSF